MKSVLSTEDEAPGKEVCMSHCQCEGTTMTDHDPKFTESWESTCSQVALPVAGLTAGEGDQIHRPRRSRSLL